MQNNLLCKFTECHCHTEYSNLRLIDSTIKSKDLLSHANKQGLKGVCITDHECLSSHVNALEYAKKIQESNPEFKLGLGNEIYLCDTREKNQKYNHFILIAKDDIGHLQLRQLSSRAWEHSFFDRGLERVVTLKSDIEEIVKSNQGHIFSASACLGSELSQSIIKYLSDKSVENKQAIHEFICWSIECFGKENFFIELQASDTLDQISYNKFALIIAKAYGLKHIITNDVHYLEKKDFNIHQSFLNSKNEEREVASFYKDTYMKTVEEMLSILSYLEESEVIQGIENTNIIYEGIIGYTLNRTTAVPEIEAENIQLQHLFKDWYSQYEFLNNFAMSSHQQDLLFLREIEKGFVERRQLFNEENIARIDIELMEIWMISEKLDQRLSAYYNLIQEIVRIIWEEGDSLVGVSRGSSSGFYTLFLTGIVQLNPIIHKLPHWRHLHHSREELP